MKIRSELLSKVESDLGVNIRFEKGKSIPVRNCWHFSTNGNAIDIMFYDEADFRLAMNRLYLLSVKYKVIILAFCLMGNHVHILLWGEFDECNRFVHDFVRRTSISITSRHADKHKMCDVQISHQAVTDDAYLKTVICYIIKNPPVAGIPFNAYDYPWSSGSLYFRNSRESLWTSPLWSDNQDISKIENLSFRERADIFGTSTTPLQGASFMQRSGIVFPGDYVAYELVEKVFKTHKSFNFFMCCTKEKDIESVGNYLSYLTVPIQEMRQNRDIVCQEMFGSNSIRQLDMPCRLRLARALKSRYNCSPKQIARLSGLKYEEVADLL